MVRLLTGPFEPFARDARIELALGGLEDIRQGRALVRRDGHEAKRLEALVVRCPGRGPHKHAELLVARPGCHQMPGCRGTTRPHAPKESQSIRLSIRCVDIGRNLGAGHRT